MEKEKKVKKVKKTEKKTVKEESIIIGNNEKRLIKFMALITAFFATGLAILIFVFGVISSLSIANSTKEALLNNNIVVTLLSKMNGYSINEVKDLINAMEGRSSVIIFEIIIPVLAFIGAMLLLIILAKRVMEFISDIQTEDDLFNQKKVFDVQYIISILSLVLLTTLVIFNSPSIIFYLLIELLLMIIYLLFKKCTLNKKK